MQFVRQLVLLTVLAVSSVAGDAALQTESTQQRTHLRGLLDKIVNNEPSPAPVRVLAASWEDGNVGEARKLRPISEKI
ncbi:RxLR effector, partial [Phytophthora palmivora]